jgi:hypothetical protein
MDRKIQLAILIAIVAVIALSAFYAANNANSGTSTESEQYAPPAPSPASLSLTFVQSFPQTLTPGMNDSISVQVSNVGGSAQGVTLHTDSKVLLLSSSSVNSNPQTNGVITASVVAMDVEDGQYNANFWVTYSDATGSHNSTATEISFYVLPLLKLSGITTVDFWHPFGHSTIGPSESTTLYFKVTSMSQNVIYEGMRVSAIWSISAPGLTTVPSTISLSPVGPKGTSGNYNINITSNNTPPGQYTLTLLLYSKDNQLIDQQNFVLTVNA